MKGSHLFGLSRSKGMTVDIWIRVDNAPRCFQKKISGRGKHNDIVVCCTTCTVVDAQLRSSSVHWASLMYLGEDCMT
jgi:hypothetical protein